MRRVTRRPGSSHERRATRSEEHTSELQSPCNLVCRLLLEKKKLVIYIQITLKPIAQPLTFISYDRCMNNVLANIHKRKQNRVSHLVSINSHKVTRRFTTSS